MDKKPQDFILKDKVGDWFRDIRDIENIAHAIGCFDQIANAATQGEGLDVNQEMAVKKVLNRYLMESIIRLEDDIAPTLDVHDVPF